VIKGAEANVRKLMGVPDDYSVLFLQGGASQQFAVIPQNLLLPGQSADYVDTGAWAQKAIKEAKITGKVNVIWNGKSDNFMRAPKTSEIKTAPDAAYLHICSNETIGGVRFNEWPETQAPVVADMSSEIMSRVIEVKRFGLIYAGAQKNLGPSGLALVIIRKDLAARCPQTVNTFYRYATHMEEPSLYNTPNTWAVYLLKLVTEWILAQGGVAAVQKVNERKAQLIYDTLDGSGFWKPCAHKDSRSIMNITWRLGSEPLEEEFVKEAKKIGLDGLKGHRSVGGIRASIYNAVSLESVRALVGFMKEFEKKKG
jgi:phosphoserine aminotransferase